MAKKNTLKKYFYIQQTSLPGFKRKRTNWAFRLKALECGYLNTGQLDVVRYKPGKAVTHEEDHHVPPERHTPQLRTQNDLLPKTNQSRRSPPSCSATDPVPEHVMSSPTDDEAGQEALGNGLQDGRRNHGDS